MFTGIIQQFGTIIHNQAKNDLNQFVLNATFNNTQEPIVLGESISINGVCLTVTDYLPAQHEISFDISQETLAKTTLGYLTPGDTVNLERALTANTRMGGHYVSGHVDKTARIHTLNPIGDTLEISINGFNTLDKRYLFNKGSITIDGVSLTINNVTDDAIYIMLIPHTLKHTTIGKYKPGQLVNIEFDYIARIVAHQLQLQCREGTLSL